MINYHSQSTADTEGFAEQLSKSLRPGDVIAFEGGLGAGKTAFVRGLARGLGCGDDVMSPTFALVHEYHGGRLSLYHFDMYRVEGYEDLCSTGFFDYLECGGVLAVEWSEHIFDALPPERITICITKTGEDSRDITIQGDDRF